MFQVLVMLAATSQLEAEPLPGYTPPAAAPAVAVPAGPEPPLSFSRVPDASDAVAWAVADLALRKPHEKQYIRYLWVPPWGSVLWHQVNSFAVNSAVSQTPLIVLPEGTAGGWLIVWDLRRLAPKEDDLRRLAATWDFLAQDDPYFHVRLPNGGHTKSRQYTHLDGKTYGARYFVPAPHVEPGYSLLELETQSFAPLLRADDFLRRVTSTIEGGRYYHFAGFIRDGKRLSETEIFRTVGLDVVLSREVEGDRRAAVFQGGVTGKPRMVEQVQGAIGKARITYDLFDEDTEANRHPLYELLDFPNRSRGKEIIFERSNGLHGYILTDDEGSLVDVAPPNLASDHRTPEPVTKQLYPMLSCVRCHGPESGVRSVRNDVATLLGGGQQGDVDLFDDLSQRNGGRVEVVNRIASLFAAGDKFQSDLEESRQDYADAVFRTTAGMSVNKDEKPAVKVADELARQVGEYWYPRSPAEGAVNADRAALELGYRVAVEGEGAKLLQQMIRPGRVDVVIDGVPVEFADPAVAALRRGMSVRRQDWERVYVYAAYLISESRKGK